MNRRHFLCVAGCAGIAHLNSLSATGAATESAPKLETHRRESQAFGTNVSILVQHASSEIAHVALDAAFAELDLIQTLMSVYDEDSQLCQLNRRGALSKPHPYFVQTLSWATQLSRRTQGAFDVTVQPLWALYEKAQEAGSLPEARAIARATAKLDWRKVQVSPEQIRLQRRGMAITLNGIAQGFAADRAIAALRRHGIEHALIDTGELGALGNKSNGKDWCVGIQHPRRADDFLSLTHFSHRCLATSGDYETKFTDDCSVHHIFDPRTGTSPAEFSSVSILAPSAWLADALSTAIFVLGRDRGGKLIRQMRDVDALLVGKDGSVRATAGFPAGLSSERSST